MNAKDLSVGFLIGAVACLLLMYLCMMPILPIGIPLTVILITGYKWSAAKAGRTLQVTSIGLAQSASYHRNAPLTAALPPKS
jgi:hypothetical protein